MDSNFYEACKIAKEYYGRGLVSCDESDNYYMFSDRKSGFSCNLFAVNKNTLESFHVDRMTNYYLLDKFYKFDIEIPEEFKTS